MKFFAKYGAVMALAVGAVTVRAQTPSGTPGPSPAPPSPSPSSASLSLDEMQTRVGSLGEQLELAGRRIEHLRATARRQKDVIKLTCINDKAVELKAERNIFDLTKLRFDAATDDLSSARSTYDELAEIGEQVARIKGDAEACAGVPELYKQESRASVEHPEFPDDPTKGDPFGGDEGPPIEPPGYASPFN